MLQKLKKKIDEEIRFQKQMLELLGSLDLILTSNTLRTSSIEQKGMALVPLAGKKESTNIEVNENNNKNVMEVNEMET